MSNELLIALLSLAGTLVGSLGGILASNRLITYRLGQLEKKVEVHNNLVTRMTIAEQSLLSAWKRIDEIKAFVPLSHAGKKESDYFENQ